MAERFHPSLALEEVRAKVVEPFNALDFIRAHGIRVEMLDDARMRAVIDPVRPEHRGGIQSTAVNGGVLASSFDLALGFPGLVRAFPEARTATVQLSMSFMAAVRGDVLSVESWINRSTRGLVFTEAQAFDEKGKLCATAQGVARLMAGFEEPRAF